MIPFIGLASGVGAGDPRCGKGPLFLKEYLSLNADWRAMILPRPEIQEPLKQIELLNRELAEASADLTREETFFISIGGDHSCGVGMWSGVASALRPKGDLGLLWIDAHMDSHTPETSESGNIHGMPLAALLGRGDPSLTQIGDPYPKIKPENVVLIGIRSFETGEEEFLKSLNVRIYFMSEIRERGLDVVMKEALQTIAARTAGIGVSFDLDSIDPSFASAVGTPVPGGIHPDEILSTLSLLEAFPLLAFELVEYIPSLDQDLQSFHIIQKLLHCLSSSAASIPKQLELLLERNLGHSGPS